MCCKQLYQDIEVPHSRYLHLQSVGDTANTSASVPNSSCVCYSPVQQCYSETLSVVALNRPSGQWRTKEFFFGGGSTNSFEDRGQNEDLGCGSPLFRGSGGICNLVQEISFHVVKFC